MSAGELLLLDVGNSRLKWSLSGGRGVAIPHAGEPLAALTSLPAELPGLRAIWISNVTGEAQSRALGDALFQRYGLQAQLASVQGECAGLRVAYAEPARLGVDRWLAMLALWSERRGAFVVAGCGTALTFDVVDAQGQHLGGVIAPGLLTAQRAVLGATRFAASGPDLRFDAGLGTDTEACVRQGALHACAGLVERLAGTYAEAASMRVLSGGDAVTLAAHLNGDWQLREDLVAAGLLVLAAQLR